MLTVSDFCSLSVLPVHHQLATLPLSAARHAAPLMGMTVPALPRRYLPLPKWTGTSPSLELSPRTSWPCFRMPATTMKITDEIANDGPAFCVVHTALKCGGFLHWLCLSWGCTKLIIRNIYNTSKGNLLKGPQFIIFQNFLHFCITLPVFGQYFFVLSFWMFQ